MNSVLYSDFTRSDTHWKSESYPQLSYNTKETKKIDDDA